MNKSKLDRIIKNRAQERVEKKINEFREEVGRAFLKLHPKLAPSFYSGWRPDDMNDEVKAVMANLAIGGYLTPRLNASSPYGEAPKWPAVLWETEEDAVEKELVATLDEMQKALCAADAADSEIKPLPAKLT